MNKFSFTWILKENINIIKSAPSKFNLISRTFILLNVMGYEPNLSLNFLIFLLATVSHFYEYFYM